MEFSLIKRKKGGYTIVESLVAITILVLVISGVTGALQTGISAYRFSKDQVIAFYLAQEAIEHIRNIRDGNSLVTPPQPWLTGIAASTGDPCYFGTHCVLDAPASTLERCPSGPETCPVLRQNTTNGLYGLDPTWGATQFTRSIHLTYINDIEISILVTIEWSKGSVEREFRARENILNWQ